jgi:elongation factor G
MGQRKDAHVLNAIVPLSRMFGYATDLRSITQGRAVFHMEFSNFKQVPSSIRDEIIEKVQGKEK